MELYEAIYKRRTIRGFTKGTTEEILRKIVHAATRAMSAGNRQHWEFIIVDDPKLISEIGEHKYQQNLVSDYPREDTERQKTAYQNCSVVAVCHKEGRGGLISAWMAVQNMGLAATADGLGVVASTFWGEHQKQVAELLGVPQGYELTTVMLVGVQEGYSQGEFPDVERRPDFSWLYRNKFGTAA
ncbi:nitroreductase family protein [Chloroflexota bacterium]